MACFWRHGTKLMLVSIAAAAGSRKFTPSPIMAYVSTGVFSISNYDSTLTYTATLVSGSGTATFNASNGRYTLSSTDARFSVTSRYAPSAPASNPDFMERKPYTYSCRTVQRTGTRPCCCVATCNGYCTGGEPCPPGVGQGFQECGCPTFFCGTISVTCGTETFTYNETVCDVLIDQPGYINSGTEWYKVN